MPLRLKPGILDRLKAAGYSSYRIRKEKLFSESTLTRIRNGEPIAWEGVEALCKLLNCQPGEILEYTPDDTSGET